MTTTRWLTAAEVAEAIQETPENVGRRCAAGQIRARKLGGEWRILEQDLIAFMEADNGKQSPRTRIRSTASRRRSA